MNGNPTIDETRRRYLGP